MGTGSSPLPWCHQPLSSHTRLAPCLSLRLPPCCLALHQPPSEPAMVCDSSSPRVAIPRSQPDGGSRESPFLTTFVNDLSLLSAFPSQRGPPGEMTFNLVFCLPDSHPLPLPQSPVDITLSLLPCGTSTRHTGNMHVDTPGGARGHRRSFEGHAAPTRWTPTQAPLIPPPKLLITTLHCFCVSFTCTSFQLPFAPVRRGMGLQ